MKNKVSFLIILFALMALSIGCKTLDQWNSDVALSKNTPLQEGETSPEETAHKIGNSTAGLPYGAGVVTVPLVTFVSAWFLNKARGKRIRLQTQNLNTKPITGHFGNAIGAEAIVQFFADLRASIFDVGPDGSAIRRGWKAALYTLVGSATFAQFVYHPAMDIVQHFTTNPPTWLHGLALTTVMAAGSALTAFLEKQLAKVEPLHPVVTNPVIPQ